MIARQWSWEFRYPDSKVSSTELHLPVDRPVTFRLNSDDVLHGFYIPAFRLKQDVIPGRSIDFNLTPPARGATDCGIPSSAVPGSRPIRPMWWWKVRRPMPPG